MKMNKTRRNDLSKIIAQIEEAKCNLETLRDEEQDYFDNKPENMQSGDKGSAAESAISEMEDAISNLESTIANIETAMGE
jgi:flagellar biosynthesis chaperone FliJ